MDYLIQINHAFTFAMIPNNPDGLKINTKINNKKAYISLWLGDIYAAPKFSKIPTNIPPSNAPGKLPNPPTTAAAKAFINIKYPIST